MSIDTEKLINSLIHGAQVLYEFKFSEGWDYVELTIDPAEPIQKLPLPHTLTKTDMDNIVADLIVSEGDIEKALHGEEAFQFKSENRWGSYSLDCSYSSLPVSHLKIKLLRNFRIEGTNTTFQVSKPIVWNY